MVKTYLRYAPQTSFGVITSSGICYDPTGEQVITGTLETVSIWNARRGIRITELKEEVQQDKKGRGEVTEVTKNETGKMIAVGYTDGSILLWNPILKSLLVTLNGHKSAVSALRFNKSGSLLASGSKDTNIILWDVISESGLFKLKGHKDMVTEVIFLEKTKKLVSSSKDTFIKIWDLDTQHCVQTIVSHRDEVWSLDINPEETRLVSGSSDNKLLVFSLDSSEFPLLQQSDASSQQQTQTETEPEEKHVQYYGSIDRGSSKERVVKIRFNSNGSLLGCLSADNSIQFFAVASEEQIKKKRRKRKSRSKKKRADDAAASEEVVPLASDEFNVHHTLAASSKIKSFAFSPKNKQIAVSLVTNKIEFYSIDQKSSQKISSVELAGHRTDVRDVAISSDGYLLASVSSNLLKIWNIKTQNCIKTMNSGYGLCVTFVTGNKHVIVGTKTGGLELYDLSSSTCIDEIEAHTGSIWSIDTKPDNTCIVTGSADKSIKFWDFELVSTENNKGKRLGLSHRKTVKMTDDVLCVKYTPDSKLIAVSLLDSTVKIFKEESMEFFLSLYGHKLPVLTMDISFDSQLIVTASADKNIKIWGLDFGDCHKSIFAHDDSIMQLKFVHGTHYFFSVSRDKQLKYWDADSYQHLQTLEGHMGAVWCLCVDRTGELVVTGSQDKSIRLWKKTDDLLFLEEEREKALESMFEAETVREEVTEGESAPASRRTAETVKAAERLLEALKIGQEEKLKFEFYQLELQQVQKEMPREEQERKLKAGEPLLPPPQPSPLLLGKNPEEYLLKVLREIKSSELEEALLVLPYASVESLFEYINIWIQKGIHIELMCRCAFFLLKVYQTPIAAHKAMLETLTALRYNTRQQLQATKDIIGYNRSAMNFLKRTIEMNTNTEFFEEALQLQKKKKKKQKVQQ